jgi:arylsulfatase A-like enzyme
VIKVDPPKMKDYHFSVDMTNQAINWVKAQQSMTPDKPFFVYYATGAVHAPHHVPKEWADKYKGQFDKGWDQVRNETLERQKKLGVIPANTRLGDRPKDIQAWNSLPAEHRRLFARQAEVFAGFLEHTDNEIGRFKKALEDIGELDNTLFIYIAGDNGTSAEGGFVGMYDEMTYFNGVAEKVEDLIPLIDKWGGTETFPHMAAGWAVAFDTPFTWTKQVASDFGGTRNGMVIHWPKGIKAKNEIRTQFSHVIDVAPTILQAAGLPEPKVVNGTPQIPMQGKSLMYSFENGKAKERHTTQYFEIAGNRAIYHDGWLARTIHRAPWEPKPRRPLKDDVWELYDVRSDFSLANDLGAKNPKKVAEMKAVFMKEAEKYHVLPVDDRMFERLDARAVGRPDLMAGRTSLTLAEGMTGMMEGVFVNVKNRSKTITAEIEVPQSGANGTVITQGGRFGGWSLYVKDGVPAYDYNFLLAAHLDRCHRQARSRQGYHPFRVRLRRRRSWQRRDGNPVREQREGCGAAHRAYAGRNVFRGRDRRCGHRPGHAGGGVHRFRGEVALYRANIKGHGSGEVDNRSVDGPRATKVRKTVIGYQ